MSPKTLKNWFAGRDQGSRPRRAQRRHFEVEGLERREVMAGLSGGLSNGVLAIYGTTGADKITLNQSGNAVSIEGYTNTWNAGSISQIKIISGDGDDTVRVAVSKQLAATLVTDGGSGRDTLYTTAQPQSWTGFEAGYLISPPDTGTSAPSGGVQVVWTGNTGPYDVTIYRSGSPTVGELYGSYQTREQAQKAVADIQQWASTITPGYWSIGRVTVEGQGTGSGTTGQSGSSDNSYDTAFANVFNYVANSYNQLVNKRTQIYNQMNNVASRYRNYYNIYQNALRIRNGIDQAINNANMSVRDVYNRYAQQPRFVWTNPSVLTFAAQQIRQQADWARNYVNQNLSGDVLAPVRNAALSALQILYNAADTMSNLSGAITRARGV